MTRLALINVKYSPNLGDGVIAECLEATIRTMRPDWEVKSVDLAGREKFSNKASLARGFVLSALKRLPQPLRRTAMATLLKTLISRNYSNHWGMQLSDVDAVIVGGGPLLSDADLNFPRKIHACLHETAERSPITALFGVGVSSNWSSRASSLFLTAFGEADLAYAAVRDGASQANWNRHIEGTPLPQASLCRDPGFLAADIYPAPIAHLRPDDRPLVGVGIVHPNTLSLHADEATLTARSALSFWVRLCDRLAERGYRICLFTNGPSDDEAFLNRVEARLSAESRAVVQRAPQPTVPAELVATLSQLDLVIAHRLHANIVAYAYGIASVGLSWDSKIPAFFDSIDRSAFAVSGATPDPIDVAVLAEKALATPIDPVGHARILQQTRDGIARCIETFDRVTPSEFENASG